MKTPLSVCVLCIFACSVFGQGQINLISNGPAAPVYGLDSRNIESQTLDPAYRDKLGEGYTFEIWYAAGSERPESVLMPLVRGEFAKNGVFLKRGTVDIPGVWGGERVTLQVRVWKTDNRIDSWDDLFDAFNNSLVPIGKSAIITKVAGGRDVAGNVVLPLSLAGAFPSFGLYHPIPEPSVIGIGMLGIVALVFRQRR